MKTYSKMFVAFSFSVVPFVSHVARQAEIHIAAAVSDERCAVTAMNVRLIAAVAYSAAKPRLDWSALMARIRLGPIGNSASDALFLATTVAADANRVCEPRVSIALHTAANVCTDNAPAVSCRGVLFEARFTRNATLVI